MKKIVIAINNQRVRQYLEINWSSTILNLGQTDFTDKAASILCNMPITEYTHCFRAIDVFFNIIDNDIFSGKISNYYNP